MVKSDAIPVLDEKIRGLKTEISGKLRQILGFLEKEDGKRGAVGDLIEYFRNEYEFLHAQFDNLSKAVVVDQKAAELKRLEEDAKLDHKESVRALLEQNDEIFNFKDKAASHEATLNAFSAYLQQKIYQFSFRIRKADATIAKQSAEISKLTEELTRAGNLKLELEKRNEIFQKRWMELLLDQVENPDAIIERDWHILQLEEAQAKMASEVGEKMNQALKGMETLSVKFEEEFGELVSRISEIKNEVKVVMKWITANRIKHNQLKREIARLVEEFKEEKDEMEVVQKSGEDGMRRLNQIVERGEEKIGELEKMIGEKDEQMKELETKMSEKESTISTLSETLQSIITTATTKMSMASS